MVQSVCLFKSLQNRYRLKTCKGSVWSSRWCIHWRKQTSVETCILPPVCIRPQQPPSAEGSLTWGSFSSPHQYHHMARASPREESGVASGSWIPLMSILKIAPVSHPEKKKCSWSMDQLSTGAASRKLRLWQKMINSVFLGRRPSLSEIQGLI